MTNEEAIKVITTLLYNQTGVMGNDQREGVFMAIEALEKQIPKKPIGSDDDVCPCCGAIVGNYYANTSYGFRFEIEMKADYCLSCGQRLERR